jgi:hypothetical protein
MFSLCYTKLFHKTFSVKAATRVTDTAFSGYEKQAPIGGTEKLPKN